MIITEERRQALIADCKAEISKLERAIKNVNSYARPAYRDEFISDYQSQLLRQQIALASMEGKPKWFVSEHEMEYGGITSLNSKGEVAIYTAPPVPVIKPIELPDLRQTVSGERYVWSDGVYNFKQDVIAAILAAGYEIKGGEL